MSHDHDPKNDKSKALSFAIKQFLQGNFARPHVKSNAKSIWAAAAEMEPNPLADLPPTAANKRRVSLDLGPSLVPSFVVLPCFGDNAFGLTYRSSPSYEGSATRVRQAPWRTRTERSVDIAKAN